eukprot:TRINITY_DN1801_c0_g1_i1.p1 TRINITY_DN1801_c0_g1~~TRINITY_DN1801_c0_g1_i1.p1  ORF type:complete len:272 (-),score=40.14 TRINITY_DN1801_c0_g1_i1:42-857(-)
MAWAGAINFYNNVQKVRAIYDRFRDGKATRKEFRLAMITQQDWKKIIPILFWIKILPFSSLYVPFILMRWPMLLPSTFDISMMAGLESRVYLFDTLRDRRASFLSSPKTAPQKIEALEFIDKKPSYSANEILSHSKLFMTSKLDIYQLSRSQLQSVLMGMGSSAMTMWLWPRSMLISRLLKHFQFIAEDDKLLTYEEIQNMTKEELVETNLERGLHVRRRSKAELQDQIREWLKLKENTELACRLVICYHAFEMLQFRMSSSPLSCSLDVE